MLCRGTLLEVGYRGVGSNARYLSLYNTVGVLNITGSTMGWGVRGVPTIRAELPCMYDTVLTVLATVSY